MQSISLSDWIEKTRDNIYKQNIMCISDNVKRNGKLELLNQLENERENITSIY